MLQYILYVQRLAFADLNVMSGQPIMSHLSLTSRINKAFSPPEPIRYMDTVSSHSLKTWFYVKISVNHQFLK